MRSIKVTDYVTVIKPEYVFLKLRPNNAIRNNSTHKIARTISSLYKNLFEAIKREERKLIKVMGRSFFFPTKISIHQNSKVSYYVYMEKKKVEFYFIIPKHCLSLLKEKMSDSWSNVTIEQVAELPAFRDDATKYQLHYRKEDGLSLAVDRRNNDLLQSNLNVVEVLEEGDKVGILYNFLPSSQHGWKHSHRHTIDKVKNHKPVERNKLGFAYALKYGLSMVDGLIVSISEAISGKRTATQDDNSILASLLERLNGGKRVTDSSMKKAGASILPTQIVVFSQSENKLRERNAAISLAQSFESLNEDNEFMHRSLKKNFKFTDYSIGGAERSKFSEDEAQNFISLAGRDILEKFNFIEKVETHETEVPEDLRKGSMRIGTNRYRGHDQAAYLSSDKEYQNLTLVLIGPTRAGKTTLIGNLSYDAIKAGECVIVFDFVANCELSSEVSSLFPADKALVIDCGDPKTMQGLGYNEVGYSPDPFQQYDNAKKQTTQLMTLVNSINTDDTRLSAKMERYLTSAALVVFIQGGSIRDVFTVLTDHNARNRFVEAVPACHDDNLSEYIASLSELDEKSGRMIAGTKDHLITGVIDRLNKLKANTYMEAMLKRSTKGNVDLVKELQKNQLICIKMPESMFATDGERDVYTTYWMTKLWLALQIRKQQIPDRSKMTKVNLVIDELYQVKNTEGFLTEKLSRLAKFSLKPIISCHYLNQIKIIREELRSANASYMLISGCDKNNYNELKDELKPFTVEDLLKLPRFHSLNLIKSKEGYSRFITKLPPEVSAGHKQDISRTAPLDK